MSLPLRECGLKSLKQKMLAQIIMSLPLRECGLKSYALNNTINSNFVTPLAGVWIEIMLYGSSSFTSASLPLRECGLKLLVRYQSREEQCHSPCGSVD